MRSIRLLIILLSLASSVSYAASLREGTVAGGGGSDLVAHFSALAQEIIESRRCSYKDTRILQKTLEGAAIQANAVLMDPRTNFTTPVPNQEGLIAYGSPGLIQLKTKTMNRISYEDLMDRNQPLAHHVAHELFRASGESNSDGTSIDDTYQKSIGSCGLDDFARNSKEQKGFFCLMVYPHSFLHAFFHGGSGATEKVAQQNARSSCYERNPKFSDVCKNIPMSCAEKTSKLYRCRLTIVPWIGDDQIYFGSGANPIEAEHAARKNCMAGNSNSTPQGMSNCSGAIEANGKFKLSCSEE